MALVRFSHVHHVYPRQIGEGKSKRRIALADVSFQLEQGETLGVIGVNGAGKSTCIRLLMNFIRQKNGDIELFGRPPSHAASRARLGYLPEIPNFPKNITCMEMMRFCTQANGMRKSKAQDASEHWLKRMGLWEDRNRLLRNFSKGMRQRASFAMALVHDPEVLILDEPMSGLDPKGRAEIVSLLQELRAQGKSMLFCSHLLDDVERIADKIVILHRGSVRYHGSIDALLSRKETHWILHMRDGSKRHVPEKLLIEEIGRSEDIIENIAPASNRLEQAFLDVIGDDA